MARLLRFSVHNLSGTAGVASRRSGLGIEEHDGEKTYRLKAEWFGPSFIMLDNGQEVGSLVPRGMFTRKTSVSLPDELPLPVQMFVIWLTLYQRETDAGALAVT